MARGTGSGTTASAAHCGARSHAWAEQDRLDEALRELGCFELDGGSQRRPDLYMLHPRSGFSVRNQTPRSSVSHRAGPPRIIDTVPGPFAMNEVEVEGSERPPSYLFRAVSEADYEQALACGHLRSDGRMNLSADEGTVASFSNPLFYLPGGLASDPPGNYPGRILRIAYRDEDGWRYDPRDGYAKTSQSIPIERIDATLRLLRLKDERGFTQTRLLDNK